MARSLKMPRQTMTRTPSSLSDGSVTLQPMEIKTFKVQLEKAQEMTLSYKGTFSNVAIPGAFGTYT